jgi:hypothetical protein
MAMLVSLWVGCIVFVVSEAADFFPLIVLGVWCFITRWLIGVVSS